MYLKKPIVVFAIRVVGHESISHTHARSADVTTAGLRIKKLDSQVEFGKRGNV